MSIRIKTGDGKIFEILCKLHPYKYVHYKLFAAILEIGKKNECLQKRKEIANQIYENINNDLLSKKEISKTKYLKNFQKLMQDNNLNCINSGSSTVNYWEKGFTSIGEPIKISTANKYLISDYFGYSIYIWSLNTDNKNLENDIKILKKNYNVPRKNNQIQKENYS